MAESNWWDSFTTRLGDALIAPQQPFGVLPGLMPAPTTEQRGQMIGSTLLSLGTALSQGARQRLPIGESIGTGWQAAQQAGAQRSQQQLQMGLLGSKLNESKRTNETRDLLRKMKPPEGVDAALWPMMVESATGPDMIKMLMEANKDARVAKAYGVDPLSGVVPPAGAGTSGAPPKADGNVFDIPQQFAPQVTAASQKHGVPPQLLASTFWNESRWNPNAVNPNDQGPGVNSVGLGQWGEQWAKARGFDPRDPNASIEHTAQAMAENAKRYGGNWMLARLAYGWGAGNVDKWLAAGGDPNKLPDGARVWLPRTAFGIADDAAARAAFPKVAGMLRPGPIQSPWEAGTPAVGQAATPAPMPAVTLPGAGQTAQMPQPTMPPGTPAPMPNAAPQPSAPPAGPIVPVQAAPPGVAPPGAPPARPPVAPPAGPQQGQPTFDPRSDPQIMMLARSRQAALAARQFDRVSALDQAIAARMGALADQSRNGPDLVEVWNPQTKEVLRIPRAQAAGLPAPTQEQLRQSQEQQNATQRNQDVILGPDGRPMVNPQKQEAEISRQAAQGENAARIQTQNKAGGVIAEKAAAQFADLRDKAASASTEVEAIHAARQVLDQGAFTGLGANQGVLLGRVGEFLGIPSDKAVNTQVYGSVVASRVANIVKQFGAGAGISNADREYAEKAAGSTSFDEAAIRRLLDIGERTARGVITKFNKEGEGWRKTTPNVETLPDSVFVVPSPAGYGDWTKQNPLTPLQRGPIAAPPTTGGSPQTTQQPPTPSLRWDPQKGKLVPVQ